MGHFCSGVVIVTAQTPNGPAGFTCQTFGSLSLEPILVMFSAGQSSQSWPKIREVGNLVINILAADQERLARVFATSGVDKFDAVSWEPATNGAPMLGGALAHIEGTVNDVVTYGDHDVVIVDVTHVHATSGLPLAYFRGGYGTFAV